MLGRVGLFVVSVLVLAAPACALDTATVAAKAVAECKAIYREDATPAHKHPCPCPDDVMANGAVCGGRSAYAKPGGARPICSAKDLTPDIVAAVNKGDARAALEERCSYAHR